MKISKELLEAVFESKIKEFMNIDSKTLYIKWNLSEEELKSGITKHFYIYYSELISHIKNWALQNKYAITSGINKDILNSNKKLKNYYDNYYIAEMYGRNSRKSLTGFNELSVVHDLAKELLSLS